METRIALAVCVVLGCALSGKAAADAQRRRVKLLDALVVGLRALRVHMIGMLEPVRSALEHSGFALFDRVAGGMADGRSAHESWLAMRKAAMRRGGAVDALTEADIRALDRLFEGLGQSGREEQEALLGATQSAVEALLDGARRRAGEADRLYLSLGLLTGLMLALIVI